MTPAEQLAALKTGVVDLHDETDLLKLLSSGRPLRVKAGFDPTRPDLHLGHTVLMNKMRQFQELGHIVVFVVGDFTAQIGDPSGRSATRPPATAEQIQEGARTYAEQAFKILSRERVEVVYNSSWLNALTFQQVLGLAGKYTLARMMERDDFKKRWREHVSISLHELLYPLVQAYDSVALKCDVELGGTDQLFNLMVGREIMRDYGQRPQVVMTTPILEGLSARMEDGKLCGAKMSKSLDNYVGVDELPAEQFGKLMSISDDLMWRYYELLSHQPPAAVEQKRSDCSSGAMNPKTAKVELASEIVARYHGAASATKAHADWEAQFSQRQVPLDIPDVTLSAEAGQLALPRIVHGAGLVPSLSEARRRITAGAVSVDGEKLTTIETSLPAGKRYIVKAGKRAWAAVTLV